MESNEVAIVTGATKGLGRAVAKRLIQDGHSVVAVGRSQEDLDSLREEVQGSPLLTPIRADLSSRETLDAAIDAVLEATGERVSVLVNNAAVQHFEDVDSFDLDLFEKTLFVNTLVPFALAQAVLPAMTRAGRGTIVNIASDLAYRPQVRGAAYVASKWGLLGMSQVLQEEVRERGVRVCVVEPGWIATGPERERRQREGHMLPTEVADVVAWVITTPDSVRLDRVTLHPPAQGTWG